MRKVVTEKVINLEYGLIAAQEQLSRNLPSRNGNVVFNLEKTLWPSRGGGGVWGACFGDAMVTQSVFKVKPPIVVASSKD